MIYPKIPLAQSIIEICHAKGVKDIIISPGSRNAPLTIGFTNNPKFTCYSIADERCAAFFALIFLSFMVVSFHFFKNSVFFVAPNIVVTLGSL